MLTFSRENRVSIRACAVAVFLCLFATLGGIARAGLGDTIPPTAVGATARAVQGAYTIVEQTDAASGATIEQYLATGSNQVFAITWSGPHQPNLQTLLSSYFGVYSNALANQKQHSLHVAHVDTGSLVVDMTGHPGNFRGAAWAPALVPAGVDVSQLVQ